MKIPFSHEAWELSNIDVAQDDYLQIGLWLLSGAVTRQTVQVFQPNVSTLKS